MFKYTRSPDALDHSLYNVKSLLIFSYDVTGETGNNYLYGLDYLLTENLLVVLGNTLSFLLMDE